MRMTHFFSAPMIAFFGLLACSATAAHANDYSEGQVWEYNTRPIDPNSILKIQRIETDDRDAGPYQIYHISIINVRIAGGAVADVLPHLPVSQETLDMSVTQLFQGDSQFPSADEGIEAWREADGGVFSISVAEIVDIADQTVTRAMRDQ